MKNRIGPKQLALNAQQQRFVREYLIDLSIKRAALRAGYNPTNAIKVGSALMAMPQIKEAVAEAQQYRAKEFGISQDRVLAELAKIGFANLKDILSEDEEGNTGVNLKDLSRDDTAPIQELQVSTIKGKNHTKVTRIKLSDKITALINIGKHIGMFKDQVQVTGTLSLEKLIEQSFVPSSPQKIEFTPQTPPDVIVDVDSVPLQIEQQKEVA